jgi:hypothetical protein
MYLKYLSLRLYLLFSFQFFTRLAAVFSEEVGDVCFIELDGPI